MYDLDSQNELKALSNLEEFGEMNTRKWMIIVVLIIALITIVSGSIFLGWDLQEQSAIFLTLGIIVGIISGFNGNTICKEFFRR